MADALDRGIRFGYLKKVFLGLAALTITLLCMTYGLARNHGYKPYDLPGKYGFMDPRRWMRRDGTNDTGSNTQYGYMDPTSWLGRIYNGTKTADVHRRESEIIEGVRKVRLLCLILTMEKDLNTKTAAVNKTWAARCDKHFYIIYSKQKRSDFLNIDVPDDRRKLVFKIQEAFKIIYEKYINDFDYVLKCDDDTYVVVENLKYLLWHYNSNEPGYLGYHFNKFVSHGYMSGGAGYVISNRGVRNLVERGYNGGLCAIVRQVEDPENSEDVETSRCLEKVGVQVWSSLDKHGKETFHPFTLDNYLGNNLPGYVYGWAKNPVQTGEKCCATYVISYHYVNPQTMAYIDHLLYRTSVFGLRHDESLTSQVNFQAQPVEMQKKV